MTKREMYQAVIDGKITDEVINGLKEEIAKLDKTNEKRRAKKNEEQSATDEVILAALTAEPAKANAIVEAINATLAEGEKPYTSSRVVASCKRLADEGKVVITKEEKGSRNISYYALAEVEGENED